MYPVHVRVYDSPMFGIVAMLNCRPTTMHSSSGYLIQLVSVLKIVRIICFQAL